MKSVLLGLVVVSLVGASPAVADPAGSAPAFTGPGVRLLVPGETSTATGSVAISADGMTALAPTPFGRAGAASVFVRSGSKWVWQARLAAADATEGTFGAALALSADGDTALIGYGGLNAAHASSTGVWVFVRSGSVWTQQGQALIPAGAEGATSFGSAVALSADGDTALVGSRNLDRVWVFVRHGSRWSQQGPPLTSGEPGVGTSFGSSVALSWSGDVALIGASRAVTVMDGRNAANGAAWVFRRFGSVWTQEGEKLTGDGGDARFGESVALSGDGQVALVGAPGDGTRLRFGGAVWGFVRTADDWKQQGAKLFANDATNSFGQTLTLSASGRVALVAGFLDGNLDVWAFSRSASSWVQLGDALPRRGELQLGHSLALTPEATTAIITGHSGSGAGTTWLVPALLTRAMNPVRPTISKVLPSVIKTGTRVAITGTNLTGAAVVRFAGLKARFTLASPTSIDAIVPARTTTGKVTVTTPNGTATSATSLTIKSG